MMIGKEGKQFRHRTQGEVQMEDLASTLALELFLVGCTSKVSYRDQVWGFCICMVRFLLDYCDVRVIWYANFGYKCSICF